MDAARIATVGAFIVAGIGTTIALAYIPPGLYLPVGWAALVAFRAAYHAAKLIRTPERDDADVPE